MWLVWCLLLCLLVSIQASIVPFKVNVPQTVLDDLRVRLDLVRWPDTVEEGNQWHYGANLAFMKVQPTLAELR